MAGPQFVGPTGPQQRQGNVQMLLQGLQSMSDYGKLLEAQRQFNDQMKLQNEQEGRLQRQQQADFAWQVLQQLSASNADGFKGVATDYPEVVSKALQLRGVPQVEADRIVGEMPTSPLTSTEIAEQMRLSLMSDNPLDTLAQAQKNLEKAQTVSLSGATDEAGTAQETQKTTSAKAPTAPAAPAAPAAPKASVPVEVNMGGGPGRSAPLSRLQQLKAAVAGIPLSAPGYAALVKQAADRVAPDDGSPESKEARAWIGSDDFAQFVQQSHPVAQAQWESAAEPTPKPSGPVTPVTPGQAGLAPQPPVGVGLQALVSPTVPATPAPKRFPEPGAPETNVAQGTSPSNAMNVAAKMLSGEGSLMSARAELRRELLKGYSPPDMSVAGMRKMRSDPEKRKQFALWTEEKLQDPGTLIGLTALEDPKSAATIQASGTDWTKVKAYYDAYISAVKAGTAEVEAKATARKAIADANKATQDAANSSLEAMQKAFFGANDAIGKYNALLGDALKIAQSKEITGGGQQQKAAESALAEYAKQLNNLGTIIKDYYDEHSIPYDFSTMQVGMQDVRTGILGLRKQSIMVMSSGAAQPQGPQMSQAEQDFQAKYGIKQ